MRLRGTLIVRIDDLLPYRSEWDELAVSRSRPYCAPAWMLAWWRCVADESARLRAVAVTDATGALVGLAPFWLDGGSVLSRHRLLGAGLAAPIEPLARPGAETEVAEVVAAVLARAKPRPAVVVLDGVPSGSPWPRLLAEAWPGRRPARLRHLRSEALPQVDLSAESYEGWFSARNKNFRHQARRRRRRIEERGGRFVVPGTVAEARPRLESFARLHKARWAHRGGSAALNSRVEQMLSEAAGDLVEEGRFRLWCIDAGDHTVSAHLFVAAGSRVSCWLGGFDEEWKTHGPAVQTFLAAIEDGFSRGEGCMDMGPGGQEYKYQVADDEDRLDSVGILPSDPRYPIAVATFAVPDLAWTTVRRLPPSVRERLKRLLGRR